MDLENIHGTRRTVLKRSAALGAAGVTGLNLMGRAAAVDCNGEQAPEPQDTDFHVWVHWADGDATHCNKSSAENVANHIESEYNTHVSAFDLTASAYTETSKSTIRNYSDKDGVFGAWKEYIREYFYSGDWSGEQGDIDLYIYDPDQWDVHPGGGGAHSSGALDGASSKSIDNPTPACVINGTSAGSVTGRGEHEVTHLFMYATTDEYDYNSDDHSVFELDSDGALHSDSADFVRYAYLYNRVYPYADSSAYKCEG